LVAPRGKAESSRPGLPEYLRAHGNGFQIDLGKLPLPTNSYVANVGWVVKEGTTVGVFFGNLDRDEPGRLKTRVELRFPQEAFLNFWENSEEFFQGLKSLRTRLPALLWADATERNGFATMKAEKDHVVSASIGVLTNSGSLAEADFYDLPATDIFLSQKLNDLRRLEITPVLRIYSTTGVVGTILEASQPIADQIRPEVLALAARP